MPSRQTAILSLVACISMATGQPSSRDFLSSKQGTLILFAQRDGHIAVAADSREILTDGHVSEGCKLRLPKPTTLLAMNGRVTLTLFDTETWNGLDSANEIFSAGGVESEESIQQKEALWLTTLQDAIARNRVRPIENRQYWTILNIFTLVSGKVRIFRVGLIQSSDGGLSPVHPPVETPATGQTQEGHFGLTAALNSSKMNQPEMDRYQNLMNVQKPKASSVAELRALTLSFEQLGSDVEGRMATRENKPAQVAGPFSSATLDASQKRWITYPESPCLKFLPPPPKKKAVQTKKKAVQR